MLNRIDHWIGSRLFVPAIIAVCRLAGLSQHAFHRYAWMTAILLLISRGVGDSGWLLYGFIILVGVHSIYTAATNPDAPGTSHVFLRMFLLCCWMLFDIFPLVVVGYADISFLFGPIALAAEYATTIKTIPPREKKARKAAVSHA